jgi:hypothetical protein
MASKYNNPTTALKPAYDAVQYARMRDAESAIDAHDAFEDGLRLLLKHFGAKALGPEHLAKVGLTRQAVLDYRQHLAMDRLAIALETGVRLVECAGHHWAATAQADMIRAQIKTARTCMETLKLEDGLSHQVVVMCGLDPEKVKLFWDKPLANIPMRQPEIR